MKTAIVTEFRQKMKEHLNEIRNDQDILILTGAKKMDFVVVTLETFNAMEETAHLLSTPANTERLMESIAQDRSGKVVVKRLDLGVEQQSRRKVRPLAIKKKASTKRPGK